MAQNCSKEVKMVLHRSYYFKMNHNGSKLLEMVPNLLQSFLDFSFRLSFLFRNFKYFLGNIFDDFF